jgi:hypothetical protein
MYGSFSRRILAGRRIVALLGLALTLLGYSLNDFFALYRSAEPMYIIK